MSDQTLNRDDLQHLKNTMNRMNPTDPVWKKAFEFHNSRNSEQLKMTCKNCYPKVFHFISKHFENE